MRQVGIEALRENLSEYVGVAAAGETVLVTDGSRVVAQIGPPVRHRETARATERAVNPILAELARQGLATLATDKSTPLLRRMPVMPLSEILEELDRDREDR